VSTKPLAGRRVLLLDDSPVVRGSFARMFGYLHRIRVVGVDGVDGVDGALAAIATERAPGRSFDAVVTDLEMPGCSGLEALDRISRVDARLALRAVVFTGAHLEEGERNAIRALGYELVSKSDPHELPAAIARQIARYP